MSKAENWFIREVNKLNVDVRLETEATVDTIKALNPNTVVLAVGSLPNHPSIDGIENAMESWDILNGNVTIPDKSSVTIIGGGVVGSELAHMLCEKECKVTVLEMLPELCRGHEPMHKNKLETYLSQNADVHLNASVTKISADSVEYKNAAGEIITARSLQ